MVIRVPEQSEDEMFGYAKYLKWNESELLTADAFGKGVSIWRCATHPHGCIGFWVGHIKADCDAELHAYLAVFPSSLGALPVFEGKKAWTEIPWRRKGLGLALLRAAVAQAPVRSDSDGMTDPAYLQWLSAKGFRLRWWDAQSACFVDAACVPQDDRFTHYAQGNRWVMVLDK